MSLNNPINSIVIKIINVQHMHNLFHFLIFPLMSYKFDFVFKFSIYIENHWLIAKISRHLFLSLFNCQQKLSWNNPIKSLVMKIIDVQHMHLFKFLLFLLFKSDFASEVSLKRKNQWFYAETPRYLFVPY